MIDQMLWRSLNGERALSGFVRATAAPNDRNPVSGYVDAGLTYEGLIPSRPDNTAGIAIAYGRISPQAAAYDRDTIAATGTPMPIRDYETAIELTYQMELAPNWSLQPDLQYIVHPGGTCPFRTARRRSRTRSCSAANRHEVLIRPVVPPRRTG